MVRRQANPFIRCAPFRDASLSRVSNATLYLGWRERRPGRAGGGTDRNRNPSAAKNVINPLAAQKAVPSPIPSRDDFNCVRSTRVIRTEAWEMNNWTMVSSIPWYRLCAAPSGDRRHLTGSFTTRLCRMRSLKWPQPPFRFKMPWSCNARKHDLRKTACTDRP